MLITSALPYVNNVPHLGNIIGCVLSADAWARYCRARGYTTLFVCGTDEYGTATETKALEEGLSCQEICDKYHALHAQVYKWFNISFDAFGRTPTSEQTEVAQDIFRKLSARDLLCEHEIEQLYSVALGKFLADRYVIGTCPKCGYEDARGDQCDQCGSLLNPTELKNPKCKFSGTTPEMRSTKHLYLDLPKLTEQLTSFVNEATTRPHAWSPNAISTARAWLDMGLKERAITRDLKWGTPVPYPGYEDKVFYVWFDAPIGYPSITYHAQTEWAAAHAKDPANVPAPPANWWERWWKAPGKIELAQFMGKDNVPFHTIIFPGCELGTGDDWTLMRQISVTEYLNYEDGKFSKSRGVGVFGTDVFDAGLERDLWRAYLLAIRPESADSVFSWDDFRFRIDELNDTLGNFVNRSLKFVKAKMGGKLPTKDERADLADDSDDDAASSQAERAAARARLAALAEQLREPVAAYLERMENRQLREGFKQALGIARVGNAFFQDTELWALFKTQPRVAKAYLAACVGIVRVLAAALEPFIPDFAAAARKQINEAEPLTLTDDLLERIAEPALLFPPGHAITDGEIAPLFRKVSEEEIAALRLRFSGSQAEQEARKAEEAAKKAEKKAGKKAAAKAKGGKGGKAPAADLPVDVARVDLRVGRVLEVQKHPNADSLYVEKIDVGEEEPREVISGLVKHISAEDFSGSLVVVVANLKPQAMRGIKSHAMVLAANDADGKVELVRPPEGAAPGDVVSVEGYEPNPDEQLNPKHKVFDTVATELKTDDACVAIYRGKPLATKAGICTVATIKGGDIH